MKKKIFLVIMIFVILVSIIFYIKSQMNVSESNIYLCRYEQENTDFVIQKNYKVWLDDAKNILKLEEWKQYQYEDQIKYFYKIHDLQGKNVNVTLDSDNKILYIHGYNGEIVNENGEVIHPNYLEYLNQFVDDSYDCQFVH